MLTKMARLIIIVVQIVLQIIINKREKMKDNILDFICVLLIFACLYMLLLLGHGLDLLTLR